MIQMAYVFATLEGSMRNIILSTAAAIMLGGSAIAGGLSPVIIEDVPVVEGKPASSVSPLLIIGLLILIGVLVSRNNDDDEPPEEELEEQPASN